MKIKSDPENLKKKKQPYSGTSDDMASSFSDLVERESHRKDLIHVKQKSENRVKSRRNSQIKKLIKQYSASKQKQEGSSMPIMEKSNEDSSES